MTQLSLLLAWLFLVPSPTPGEPCPALADVRAIRTPDGRSLFQAFDSIAQIWNPGPPPGGRITFDVEDARINATLLGVPIGTPPKMDYGQRRTFAMQLLQDVNARDRDGTGHSSLVLLALIDTRGNVERASVAPGSAHRELIAAALRRVRRLRFEPAVSGDCQVPYIMRLPVAIQ